MSDLSEYIENGGNERRRGERRKRQVFVFCDRRSGFDRRVEGESREKGRVDRALTALQAHPGLLGVLLLAVNVANVADFFLTLKVLEAGGGEGNPVIGLLLTLGPPWAGVFKGGMVLLATWIIWRYRRFRLMLQAALLVAAVFLFVLAYHAFGLTLLC